MKFARLERDREGREKIGGMTSYGALLRGIKRGREEGRESGKEEGIENEVTYPRRPMTKPYHKVSKERMGLTKSFPFSTGGFRMTSGSAFSQARPRAWRMEGGRGGGREGGNGRGEVSDRCVDLNADIWMLEGWSGEGTGEGREWGREEGTYRRRGGNHVNPENLQRRERVYGEAFGIPEGQADEQNENLGHVPLNKKEGGEEGGGEREREGEV